MFPQLLYFKARERLTIDYLVVAEKTLHRKLNAMITSNYGENFRAMLETMVVPENLMVTLSTSPE